MRAKLQILREGRIPSDAALAPLLLDTNTSSSAPGIEASVPLEDEEEVPDEDDEDDGEVEGENMVEDIQLEAQVDMLMQNLLQQSEAHQSSFPSAYLRAALLTSVVVGHSSSVEGQKGLKGDGELENIYGDEDDE